MEYTLRGKVWKLGDHVDLEEIVSMEVIRKFKYKWPTPEELAPYCLIGVDPRFPKKVKKGDILVAGGNFGCGHGLHWEGPLALKGAGFSVVVAESFGRDFYRTAINFGLSVLLCKDISEQASQGDEFEVNLKTGDVKNLTTGVLLKACPIPDLLMQILEFGGLRSFVLRRLNELSN